MTDAQLQEIIKAIENAASTISLDLTAAIESMHKEVVSRLARVESEVERSRR
jgi:hypothetical protein